MRARALVLFCVLCLLAFVEGCFLQGGTAPDIGENEPGMKGYSGELACSKDSDCQSGESCSDGICQMKRCAEASAYRAAPPLGQSSYFLFSRDLVAASASSVDGYAPRDATFARVGSSLQSGGTVIDVAGGNLFGSRPEAFAVALAGASAVKVKQGTKTIDLTVGFVPIAMAAGDTDGDGTDEILAAAADGTFAICKVAMATCERRSLGANGVVDVAMGDIDADGFAEAIFLLGDRILIYNLDADVTKQQRVITQPAGRTLYRIATGDLDGDEIDEIIAAEDGGAMFWNSDRIHVYSFKNAKLETRMSKDVDRGVLDLSVVQAGQQSGRIAVLRAANIVEMLVLAENALKTDFQSQLGGAEAKRIATADIDGDSPTGRLKGEGKVVAGPTAPIAVLGIPPYSQRYSSGPSTAMLGSNEEKNESVSSSVALSLKLSVSAEFNLFGLIKAGLSAHIAATQAKTKGFSRTMSVGQAFLVTGDAAQNGFDSGAVVLGCGCFMQFDYEIDDPRQALGKEAHGKTMSVLVPVGGQTTLWSTRRYNALAAALGTLPQIRMPYKLGDLASYPAEATTLAGKPVPGDDMLFQNPPSYRVSDLATLMFQLNESTSKSNGEASTIAFGGGANAAVGINVGVDVSRASTQSYEVRVSRSTNFSGLVEPVKNNSKTPEDEFALHAYSFTPYVYREHYKLNGEDAGLYVLMYAVGK